MGHNPNMRIGTWNLDVHIDGFEAVLSPGAMTRGQPTFECGDGAWPGLIRVGAVYYRQLAPRVSPLVLV
jgi:hypothetical protein